MLWREHGDSEHAYLLLHGLGASGAVWRDVSGELDAHGDGEWLVVELPGNGRSNPLPQYSVGSLASAVAQEFEPHRSYRIIGHSLGAYIGLALASGWFGVRAHAARAGQGAAPPCRDRSRRRDGGRRARAGSGSAFGCCRS